jgi:hypothetical protein
MCYPPRQTNLVERDADEHPSNRARRTDAERGSAEVDELITLVRLIEIWANLNFSAMAIREKGYCRDTSYVR